jgi:hypothetical protein
MTKQFLAASLLTGCVLALTGCAEQATTGIDGADEVQGLETEDTGVASQPLATTLYSDDFEDDTVGQLPAGWTWVEGNSWGVNTLSGYAGRWLTANGGNGVILYTGGGSTWTNYTMTASFYLPRQSSNTALTDFIVRATDRNNFYMAEVGNNQISVWKRQNGSYKKLDGRSCDLYGNYRYTAYVRVSGTRVEIRLYDSSGQQGLCYAGRDDTSFTAGTIGMRNYGKPSTVDSMKVEN